MKKIRKIRAKNKKKSASNEADSEKQAIGAKNDANSLIFVKEPSLQQASWRPVF